jgi:hypothetical protein
MRLSKPFGQYLRTLCWYEEESSPFNLLLGPRNAMAPFSKTLEALFFRERGENDIEHEG